MTFNGTWVNNKMEGTFTVNQAGKEEKKAKYDNGVFVEWIGYSGGSNKVIDNEEVVSGDVKVGQGKKKKGGGVCCC